MIVHVISFAFLMVMASTAILSPVLLYVFGLSDLGWRWEHAAMFSAIIASTDAVAVSAVLKSGAPPVYVWIILLGSAISFKTCQLTTLKYTPSVHLPARQTYRGSNQVISGDFASVGTVMAGALLTRAPNAASVAHTLL